jgi:hypothetical protein
MENKWSSKIEFKNYTQKNLLPIINLAILYHQINFIVFVPAHICCAKMPFSGIHPTKLHPRKAIVRLIESKMPLASLANKN